MNSVQIWLCLVLVCCSAQTQGYTCRWMMSQYGIVNREALSLLKQVGGNISSEIVPFPYRLYKKMENETAAEQLRFLAEVTEQILELFDNNYDATSWDTEALDKFLHNENRQQEELQKCVTASPNTRTRTHNVRGQFKQLKKNLRKNNYSHASWEKIRKAVLLHLSRMDIMAAMWKEC